MKNIIYLLFVFCITAVFALNFDSKDANRPSRLSEQLKNRSKTEMTPRHLFSKPPAPPADEDDTNQPLCWDSRLASFVTSGLQLYPADMGKMSKYVLDQIVRARYPGSWLVHGQKVAYGTQGPDWQTLTNGNIFAGTNPNACFFRDSLYYILVVKLYG